MLLQSPAGEIRLLPALPAEWPEGSVRGIKVRGGDEVDLAWRGGKLTEVKIRPARDGVTTVRYGDLVRPAKLVAGKEWNWKP
jgi:alpha-L-fucosidase 2